MAHFFKNLKIVRESVIETFFCESIRRKFNARVKNLRHGFSVERVNLDILQHILILLHCQLSTSRYIIISE